MTQRRTNPQIITFAICVTNCYVTSYVWVFLPLSLQPAPHRGENMILVSERSDYLNCASWLVRMEFAFFILIFACEYVSD